MASEEPELDETYWERPIGWALAADGSQLSKDAAQAVLEHCALDPRDRLDVIHIDNPTKEYLPYDMTTKAIQEYFSVHAQTLFGKNNYAFHNIVNTDGKETKRVLIDTLSTLPPQSEILCVGFVGRKGPKEDPTVLGSVTDLSLRSSHMSCFIVKKKPVLPHTVFVVGVDGSQRSHDAVLLALRLARPQDTIVIVHIEDLAAQPVLGSAASASARRYDADYVSAQYTKLAASRGGGPSRPKVTFLRITLKAGHSGVADAFLAAAEEHDAEIILVGVDGEHARAHKGVESMARVGSTTDKVIRAARANVLVVSRRGVLINTN